MGLAYDFCVANTAYDAAKIGLKTYILKDACKKVSDETTNEAEENFNKMGIQIIRYEQIIENF